jgi:hypothetical protein
MSDTVKETNKSNMVEKAASALDETNTTDISCGFVPLLDETINNDSNNEEDNDSNNEEDNEEDNVDGLSSLLSPLSFTNNSDLYVVSVNDSPRFYVKDEKEASKKMWEVARKLAGTEFSAGYTTDFLKIGNQELHLIGSCRFFLIAYDIFLHRVSYSRVQECI